MEGGDDEALNGSLFEGMVLFAPSSADLSAPKAEEPPPADAAASQAQSQPLDEDLFSNLNLQISPSPPLVLDDPPPPSSSSPLQPAALPSRQPSRKKKRAVRIGYARDTSGGGAAPSEEPHHPSDPLPNQPPPSSSLHFSQRAPSSDEAAHPIAIGAADEPPPSSRDVDVGSAPHPDTAAPVVEDLPPAPPCPQSQEETDGGSSSVNDRPAPVEAKEEVEVCSSEGSASREDLFGSDRLQLLRARIAEKLASIRERAASVCSERKELERRRRTAVENLSLATVKYSDLERELEQACEAEDFERAERVSEGFATAEKEKDVLLLSLKEAEVECELAELKMHEVLELQIAAEEEGITLLEQFAKDAADYAESILKNAEEISRKELEEWQSSNELLEIKKLEMEIESQLISDACSGLGDAIEELVKDEKEEKEMLTKRGVILAKELDELLELVRLKEAEIAENKSQIQDVEKRIANVVSQFHETQSGIDLKHDNLQAAFLQVESQNEVLLIKKKEIDEAISSAEQKRKKLMELAAISSDEAKTCQDLVGLKKHLASLVLKSREDRVTFSKTEERVLEDIQILRQQISDARTALQELSSTRASIQQEVAFYKQRIDFIEKRGPELEAEKKIAAAARNFKEAGRVAAEAKALQTEKEDLQLKKKKAVLNLEQLEEEIKCNVDRIEENEGLVLLKQKEAALAGCKRLQLVAAAARAEISAALKMGDLEEGNVLLKEAEAAESKARELQEVYNLEIEVDGKDSVSLAFITNLGGDHLTELASLTLPAVAGSELDVAHE